MAAAGSKRNSLQAILDRQNQAPIETPVAATLDAPVRTRPRATGARRHTVLIGGHFPPGVAKQLGILAAEEQTTKQKLLAEALNLLFVKKGKQRITDIAL